MRLSFVTKSCQKLSENAQKQVLVVDNFVEEVHKSLEITGFGDKRALLGSTTTLPLNTATRV